MESSEAFYEAVKGAVQKKEHVLCFKGELEAAVDELTAQYDMIICSGLLHEVENSEILLEFVMINNYVCECS